MKKKGLALVLALVMVLALLPGGAAAQEDTVVISRNGYEIILTGVKLVEEIEDDDPACDGTFYHMAKDGTVSIHNISASWGLYTLSYGNYLASGRRDVWYVTPAWGTESHQVECPVGETRLLGGSAGSFSINPAGGDNLIFIVGILGAYTVGEDNVILGMDEDVKVFLVFDDGEMSFLDDSIPNWLRDNCAWPSDQTVLLDGVETKFEMYALKDAAGNQTNYIRVRDLAAVLSGTAAQFEVGWDGLVRLTGGRPYTGSTDRPMFYGNLMKYGRVGDPTMVNGAARQLAGIILTDYDGGGHTYYKLRDLGQALGFNVGWANGTIYVETDKLYDPAN